MSGHVRIAVAVAVAIAVAGCGSGGDPAGVEKTYLQAIGSGDYAKACDQISKATRKVIEANGSKCAQVLKRSLAAGTGKQFANLAKKAKIGKASVKGDRGTVAIDVAGTAIRLPVVNESGSWRVEAGGLGG